MSKYRLLDVGGLCYAVQKRGWLFWNDMEKFCSMTHINTLLSMFEYKYPGITYCKQPAFTFGPR